MATKTINGITYLLDSDGNVLSKLNTSTIDPIKPIGTVSGTAGMPYSDSYKASQDSITNDANKSINKSSGLIGGLGSNINVDEYMKKVDPGGKPKQETDLTGNVLTGLGLATSIADIYFRNQQAKAIADLNKKKFNYAVRLDKRNENFSKKLAERIGNGATTVTI